MSAPRLRVGFLPRGVDGLFLPPQEGVEPVALVRRGAPEEAWARGLYGAPQVLAYHGDDPSPYPSTQALLLCSDLPQRLREGGVTDLLMSAACREPVRRWAQQHGVRLLMTDYRHQVTFEDKLWFDGFLRRHGVRCPRGGPFRLGDEARLPRRGRLVVQVPDSMGGEGTYFVSSAAGIPALAASGALQAGRPYLLRRFIDGTAYGITVFVAPGCIALSGVRMQCYHPADAQRASLAFAGIQWLPTERLSPALRRRIERTFRRLGRLLYQRRFFGFANLDFMVDARERVFLIECNPRMSAATPQLLHQPALLSGLSAGPRFLRGFLGPRVYPRAYQALPLPLSAYAGATLDVVGAGTVQRDFQSGLYALRAGQVIFLHPDVRRLAEPDHFALVSMAQAGQRAAPDDTLATLVSNFPLYDERGGFLPAAQQLLAAFPYTD